VGLQWLATHQWKTTTRLRVSLSLIQSLIRPPSSSEAREIHQTVLSLVAEPLHLQLQAVASDDPLKQMASAIADTLGPYLLLKRKVSWMSEDIQPLTASSAGLLTSIRQTFHHLLDWSTSLETNASPPKFSSKLISAAVHLHGTSRVLLVLLREIEALIGPEKIDAGLDMLTSVICAPFPKTKASIHSLSLRDALNIHHVNLTKSLKAGDALFAEVIVRLHRRVEAISAAISQQEMAMDPANPMGTDLGNIDLRNINLEAATGNADIDVSALAVQPSSEDIDQILEGATGMDNFGTNTMASGADDVFGLEGDDMQMMNFDDMDLEGMF
jgi:mediator of RNA polymerase II transcription subunit 5